MFVEGELVFLQVQTYIVSDGATGPQSDHVRERMFIFSCAMHVVCICQFIHKQILHDRRKPRVVSRFKIELVITA